MVGKEMEFRTCQSIFLFTLLGLVITIAAQNSFDVSNFGAIGDGARDDTKAFQSAWAAACNAASNNVNIIVPSKTFLVYPVRFQGPCKSRSITFEILGKIIAPLKGAWENNLGTWLQFIDVNGLVVDGNGKGVINGRGETWWKEVKASGSSPPPSAMAFNACENLRIQGLKHMNSQRNHISISGCQNVDVSNLYITAPGDSPNTDGIDVSMTTDVTIHDIVIATGDDCIAINGGTNQTKISSVACGPGHGISIGSLGRNGKKEVVQGVTVSRCTFRKTQNGVRIKTWQGGSGFAKDIVFSDIYFDQAKNPIIIDQFYCPHSTCPTAKSAVQISDVTFAGIYGTTLSENAITLNCSKTAPCTNIVLRNIHIKSAKGDVPVICNNVRGSAINVDPPQDCLK